MKKIVIALLVLALTLSCATLIFVGCDSSSGYSKTFVMNTFRNDYRFTLPIKVQKAFAVPNPVRYFKSRMSLDKIEETIKSSTDYTVERNQNAGGEFLIVTDVEKFHIIIIEPYETEKYNYLISNCFAWFSSENGTHGYVYFPYHLSNEKIEDRSLIENAFYSFSGTIDELANLYEKNGYTVEIDDNGITVTDVSGVYYGNEQEFGDVVKKVRITLSDSKISFACVE